MFSQMTFYNSKHAPNAKRVRVFLAEKGIVLPTVEVDLGRLEQHDASYLAINAYREVPALRLPDGAVLTESIAICRYLESLAPEPNLFGANAREAAGIEMWQRRLELRLMFPIALAFRHSHPAMAQMESPQVPELAEFGRRKALAALEILEAELEGREYAAGPRFTVADITGMVCFDFMKMARIALPDHFSHLPAWRDRLRSRPSHAV